MAALLAALVILQLGYGYGEPNHTLLLPWIFRRLDPGLLANDWFANTIPHHLNFVWLMGWLGRVVPLPAAMLALHVAVMFLLLWTMHRIVARLFGDWPILCVAVFLFIRWTTTGLGGNGLWSNYLLPHDAAAPFCLLAFYLALKDRPVAAALAAAGATWIHIQLGALTMLVVGLEFLLSLRRRGPRVVVLAGVAYLVAVVPTLLPQWSLYVTAPSPLSAREFLDLHAVLRQPHHLIPSSWPLADYYRFFLVVALAALAGEWREQPHRTVAAWCAIIVGLCVAGTVFVEIWPVKLIIKLQLFRMTIFVKFFAVLYAARFLLSVLAEQGWLQKAPALAILVIPSFPLMGVGAALLAAARQKRYWLWAAWVFAAGGVAGFIVVATASLGKPLPMFWHSFAVPPRSVWFPVAALAIIGLLLRIKNDLRNSAALPAALMVLLLLARWLDGLPSFHYDHPLADEWYRFCRRVRSETPRDAVFITPPHLGGFASFAERAEVANFKSAPSIETDLIEWKRRLNDLAGATDLRCSGWIHCASALAGGYYLLGEADFRALARKYQAQFVVISQHGRRLDFPEVFRLGEFALYRVPL